MFFTPYLTKCIAHFVYLIFRQIKEMNAALERDKGIGI